MSFLVRAAFVVLLLAGTVGAQADERLAGVALVIGNAEYEHLPPLANPGDDARAIEALFDDLGFETELSIDRDAKRLRRDLDDFIEDAEGADVAVIYYAGHGIEAGGENFLVPVDADVAALDHAERRLVATSDVVARLRETVPVLIVLLDACRDSPFPAGAVLRASPEAEPRPIGTEGLSASETRGAASLVRQGGSGEPRSLGIVLGFAAEPGAAALDGAPGEHSPYAAALLRHLPADGYAFGEVMTLISEEVYLKTTGRQVPWMNTSLRRELRFSAPPAEEGPEAAISGERRRLLLSIATVGEAERRQVEARAREAGVPMDALFAMLRSLGVETTSDPARLDHVLRDQSQRLERLLAERAALRSSDPEIARLAELSATAIREGALEVAIDLNEKAKARVAGLGAAVDEAEAQVAERRREFASVFAHSAETYALAFDHARAAVDYRRAYEEIARWDPDLALGYRLSEAEALADQGYYKADKAVLRQAEATYRDALASLAPPPSSPPWIDGRAGLAMTLFTIGEAESGRETLDASARLLRETLAELTPGTTPDVRARLEADLGIVLLTLGARGDGDGTLDEAEAVLRGAEVATRQSDDRELRAKILNRLGTVLLHRGEQSGDRTRLSEALDSFRSALSLTSREGASADWAQLQNNRAIALHALAEMEAGSERLMEAVEAYRAVLSVNTRERVPLLWAESQNNVAAALHRLALRESSTARFEEAEAALRLAFEELTRERSPLKWAAAQENLANVLRNLADRRQDPRLLDDALAALRLSLDERTRDRVPADWARLQNSFGNTLLAKAEAGGPDALLFEAEAAYRAALSAQPRETVPLDWAKTQNNLANLYSALGKRENALAPFEKAEEHFRLALAENTRERVPLDWALTMHNLGQVLVEIGRGRPSSAALDEAVAAFEASRAVYREAGQSQYEGYFEILLQEVDLARLQVQVAEKIKALEQAQ